MAANVRTLPVRHRDQHQSCRPARRFYPPRGQLLTLRAIHGPWRASGTAGGAGIFAVVWSTYSGDFWAALHDFEPSDQLRLIEACRRLDIEAFGGAR